MITIYDSITTLTIALPNELFWSDEFTWCPVSANHTRLLQGGFLVEESLATGGRSITLEGASDMAWVTRSTVASLIALRNQIGRTFTLTMKDARIFIVKFDQTVVSVEANPVLSWKQTSDTDWYQIKLRLVEV